MDDGKAYLPAESIGDSKERPLDKRIYLALNEPEALGGVQRVVDVLADGFTQLGYSVIIVGVRRSGKQAGPNYSGEHLYPFPSLPLPKAARDAINKGGMKLERIFLPGRRTFTRRFERELKKRPGHVIAMDVFVAELVARVPRQNGYGLLVQYHNSFGAIDGSRDLERLVEVSAHVDAILALTPDDASLFQTVVKSPALSMPNPLPFSRTARTEPRPQRVVSVGRLVPHKGFKLLLAAWAALNPNVRSGWELRIIGDGPELTSLRLRATELGVENSVTFTGATSDVQSELKNAEVLALTSEYDGFGMVLLEAMSQSVACIATDSGPGPRDLVSRSEGLLIDVGSASQLTLAMERMLTNPDLRAQSASAGYEASQEFEVLGVVSRWEKLLLKGGAAI